MISQFFGNFLLNNNLLSPSQLSNALEQKNKTHLKLGTLAINAGFMTAAQVETVNRAQATIDKRFGDLAVDLGYLTLQKVDTLLSSQKTGMLLLSQTLIDLGYLSNMQLESAVSDYKRTYNLSDNSLSEEQLDAMDSIVEKFYHFETLNTSEILTTYISLLFKNITRFIGDDFTPMQATIVNNFPCRHLNAQNISGSFCAFTGIEGSAITINQFASRFAKETIDTMGEYTNAVVGEFVITSYSIHYTKLYDSILAKPILN